MILEPDQQYHPYTGHSLHILHSSHSGVLWTGDAEPVPGAQEVLQLLRAKVDTSLGTRPSKVEKEGLVNGAGWKCTLRNVRNFTNC